jgi:hypothetical protein
MLQLLPLVAIMFFLAGASHAADTTDEQLVQ